MLYNTTTATDYIGAMSFIQTDLGVPFSQMILIAIFFVSFFTLKRYETLKAFSGSMFITFLTSVFFWIMGLLDNTYPVATAVLLGVCVILLSTDR